MQVKQIVAVVAVVAVMGYLYAQPIVKGNVESKSGHKDGTPAEAGQPVRPAVNVTIETVSQPGKAAIGAALADKISTLEQQLKKATTDAQKLQLNQELAQQWDNVNQPAPAAFYYQALGKSTNSFQNWLTAGNRFNDAYKFTQDTAVQPAFVKNAIEAFKSARKLDDKNLDAQTGLGIAYVNQTSQGITDPDGGSPMQGITLLLDVVRKDPDNRPANLSLGQFAMKSGQYQKAVDRFKKMIAKKAELEPYFYLAESYKQLGMKPEAIAAYQKCKEMMPDAAFGQRIDDFIKELKN
jgi:tetratricopeptide (TPR) repeat protein